MIKNQNSAWIFLSHSSEDIDKVRLIRNEFEVYAQNPIAFYLRCLNDQDSHDAAMLLELLKREINVRNWFVNCNSPAADRSPYVQLERNYVKTLPGKVIWDIDVTAPVDFIKTNVKQICQDLQVYLLYAHRDVEIEKNLKEALLQRDFNVWSDLDFTAGSDWSKALANSLLSIAKLGFVLLLLTDNTFASS